MARILTVDDSPVMRQMVQATLAEAGHEVTQAANGEEALRMATSQRFELIITDINMPLMDGLTLTRNLRQLPAYGAVPLIVLTTEASAEIKRSGREAGATAWVLKPFSPQKLVETVEQLLN
ncbi:MAG TPA: response regulator [Steroidobacteraceae bacterium]|nr:response regulator [Steroidobacteraceae bacterium]